MLKHTIGAFVVAAGLTCLGGCTDKASVTTETKAVGPGGTTTTSQTTEVKTTGSNPPPPP